jgi:signal transduction histidine kinase
MFSENDIRFPKARLVISSSTDPEEAVLAERRRFADELHDVVAAGLQAVTLRLAELENTLPTGTTKARRLIAAAQEQVQLCWSEARRCAAALRPVELESHGLSGALTEFAHRLSDSGEAEVSFIYCGAPISLPADTELAILRVAQEGVTNALRHAVATAIDVKLSFDSDAVRLDIHDDGIGFNPESLSPGSGLRGMRWRARQIGAKLAVQSGRGFGTRITLTLPLEQMPPEAQVDQSCMSSPFFG